MELYSLKAILICFHSNSCKAIYNKKAPIITNIISGDQIIISGSSILGDKIELFANAGDQSEVAEKFVATASTIVTLADNTGSVTIPRTDWPFSTDSYVTATATEKIFRTIPQILGNTSPLATSVKVPLPAVVSICQEFIDVLKDNTICYGCVGTDGRLVTPLAQASRLCHFNFSASR